MHDIVSVTTAEDDRKRNDIYEFDLQVYNLLNTIWKLLKFLI